MVKREELKSGVVVKIDRNFKYSKSNAWMSSVLYDNSIEYGCVVEFNDNLTDAVRIYFNYQGERNYSWIHYKDLTIADEIPKFKKEAVLFDENNLDI